MSARHNLATRPPGHVGSMILIPVLSFAVAACTVAASPAGTTNLGASASAAATAGASSGALAIPLPANETATGVTSSGTPLGAAGGAIAYPYPIYGGTPGTAPDHSILVTGSGQAEIRADGSNAAAAERTALAKALAEAKRRADDVASATGVTISGVLSVSESVGQGWIAPLGVESPGGPATPPTSGSVPAPAPPAPSTAELDVSVTVAYMIGS